MKKSLLPCILILAPQMVPLADGKPAVDFNRDIRPILSANCFSCHGPDEDSRKGKLRLDTAAGAKKSLGPVEDSELVYRIETDDPDDLMPPADTGHVLTDEQKKLLRQWVATGAPYDVHWAFVPPTQAEVPGEQHPVDHFVGKRLKAEGLGFAKEADRYALARRVSLDLTGLPPEIEVVDAFVKTGNYDELVDDLLKSESFGEHWARMWLDLARYADTKGYEKDRPRNIWRYRDWVIDALNQDMPFDQFTKEQLAGDLLPEASTDQILATAFHRNTLENDEGGTDDEEFRVAAVKDRVDTTMQVWMGLTMGCAKCHSHKYDPISREDYYSFYSIFNQTEDADRGAPILPTPSAAQTQAIQDLEKKIQAFQEQLKNKPEGFSEALANWKKDQFDASPLWQPLKLDAIESKHNVKLTQAADGTLKVSGELPEKDTWKLTLHLPSDQPLTALRIDALPKKPGGKWKDKNVALRELTAEHATSGNSAQRLKLTNPRADFSQRGWEVAKAIDGKTRAGWAFSPKAADPHVAVFDFAKPISGGQLLLTLEMEYGQGLIFETFRLSVSSHSPKYLAADLDPKGNFDETFAREVFPPTRKIHQQLAAVRKELNGLRAKIPKTPIMRELPEGKRRETRIHVRGNFLDKGDLVEAGVPELFGKFPEAMPKSRLGVAHWLVQAENPLTARVMVNRIWARVFGIGIVETEEDFGSQGTVPSHPELLDWLAVDYRENGWSLKHLLKTMVTSRTYRQSSIVTSKSLAADPRNRLLSRGPRFRLSAETVRDQALAVSGLLVNKLGGPSVMPPQPPGVWKSTYSGEKWKTAVGPDRYRRGLYTYLKRTSPHPAMLAFDAGSGEVCQIRRVRTNTPLQALITLNDPAFVEAAGALSQRMKSLEHGFRLVLARPPSKDELQRLEQLSQSLTELFQNSPDEARQFLESAGMQTGDAAKVAVASVLLNLDETLMKP